MQNARPAVPSEMPCGFQELMMHCWEQKPEERPPMDQVITNNKSDSRCCSVAGSRVCTHKLPGSCQLTLLLTLISSGGTAH
jgi:hypothetical protein